MACYHPIPARQDNPGEPVRISPPLGEANLALPCGTCVGCRTDRATHWANRCSHEASTWTHNQFITLTYDDEHLPPKGHLKPRDLQLFLKRLRRYGDSSSSSLNRDCRAGIRFFACGEYGTHTARPHYHAILFNCGFSDLHRVGKSLYESDTLKALWPHGGNRVGEATPAAASYIAQYSLKKQAGQYPHPGYINLETGEFSRKRQPWFTRYDDGSPPAPFLRMSLKPAIGAGWIEKYHTDLQHGYLIEGGRKQRIPRYYVDRIRARFPEVAEKLALRLEQYRIKNGGSDKHTPERRAAAETIHKRRKELTDGNR